MCGHGDTSDVSTVERPCEDTGRRQHLQAKERGREETKRANTSILIFCYSNPSKLTDWLSTVIKHQIAVDPERF